MNDDGACTTPYGTYPAPIPYIHTDSRHTVVARRIQTVRFGPVTRYLLKTAHCATRQNPTPATEFGKTLRNRRGVICVRPFAGRTDGRRPGRRDPCTQGGRHDVSGHIACRPLRAVLAAVAPALGAPTSTAGPSTPTRASLVPGNESPWRAASRDPTRHSGCPLC